ncbi:Leishmanolysin [Roseovarius litorisediminis]|uniref:Leishmanolysin n=1 Tax=Roseovarius litorisediminis TaxID=1312363 RepID=A0A1Y5SUG8_9RHOB|nr:leishmanolysin-related zinc metalloendopeptidase [Roseovarius litorisediminis]SLN46766.1 Leishmanolysin [Roseovarius litorisediminis]
MKNRNFWQGPATPITDVLPPEFDAQDISSFFANTLVELPEPSDHAYGRFGRKAQDRAEAQPETAPSEIASYPGIEDLPEIPVATQNAVDALEAADAFAPVDLADLAQPLRTQPVVADEITSEEPLDGAGAKPAHAGGGKDGGGKGKNKDTVDTGGTATDGTDTGGTTTGGTDTGGTTTGGTDTGETNTGSNDPNVYVSGMDNPDGFNVEIVYIGDWSDMLRQHIQNVAEFVSDIITADIPSYNGVDDISITATMTSIDGTGGYWGWGGYSTLRTDTKLPSTGYMRFDTADVATIENYGLWEDLMLHEMLHSLGFGTAWQAMGLVQDYSGDLRFTGTNAIEAYNSEFASIASNDALSLFGVPVETDGGSGTAGVHWDDATFTKELLSSSLRANGNYLSDMSIAALEDMGYETIYGDAVTIA